MGVQSPSTLATEAIEIIRKEGLSIPVRAFYFKKRTPLEYLALKKDTFHSGVFSNVL